MRWLAVVVFAGCHVVTREPITKSTPTSRIPHPERAIAGRARLVLTDAGQLRFVEPLDCPTDEVVQRVTSTEVATKPNLATFAVGLVATAVAGALIVRGISDDHPGSSPFLYGGVALGGGGLPFAIGPWLGTSTRTEAGVEGEPQRRPGPNEPCGDRALAARAATLIVAGAEVHGTIDRDGVFAVSPYQLVDAFETVRVPSLDVRGSVDGHAIDAMLDGGALATHAHDWLAHAGFDARVEPIRLVPGLVAGTLRVSLTQTATGYAIRVVLPLENQGPGPAWAVRGHLVAPAAPSIDGRILYAGAIAKGSVHELTALIPVTESAASALRNTTVDLSIELRDAHGTAPATPVHFRGAILVDAPR